MQKDTTQQGNAFRIDKEILEKVRAISKSKGQTISGYININLSKIVDRDWSKFENKNKIQ